MDQNDSMSSIEFDIRATLAAIRINHISPSGASTSISIFRDLILKLFEYMIFADATLRAMFNPQVAQLVQTFVKQLNERMTYSNNDLGIIPGTRQSKLSSIAAEKRINAEMLGLFYEWNPELCEVLMQEMPRPWTLVDEEWAVWTRLVV